MNRPKFWPAIRLDGWQAKIFSWWVSHRYPFLLSVLSAFLFIFAFPHFLTPTYPHLDFALLAWVALVPLLLAIRGYSPSGAFCLSFFMGFLSIMGVFYWINVPSEVRWIDFLLMVSYVSLYFGIFGALFSFCRHRTLFPSWVIAPPLWVMLEYTRSHFSFLELPWGLLGHTQYTNVPVIQIATVVGVYGISFLLVMVNGVLVELWQRTPRSVLAALVIVAGVGGILLFGYLELSAPLPPPALGLTVVQGNIPQEERWDPHLQGQHFQKHIALTRKSVLASKRSSLIVWPETSVPSILPRFGGASSFSRLGEELGVHFLIGSATRSKFGKKGGPQRNRFNRAILLSPEGKALQEYNKIKLLPFGEYLPYQDFLPWPQHFFANAGDYQRGDDFTLFSLSADHPFREKFGVLICWETLFPDLTRQFVKKGATFLVNIANEAWFGNSAAPYQFFSMNVFRAVENRVFLVRAVNTGISGFIDPFGRILGTVHSGQKEVFVEGTFTYDVYPMSVSTFYTNHGDVFAWGSIMVALGLIGWAIGVSTMRQKPDG